MAELGDFDALGEECNAPAGIKSSNSLQIEEKVGIFCSSVLGFLLRDPKPFTKSGLRSWCHHPKRILTFGGGCEEQNWSG